MKKFIYSMENLLQMKQKLEDQAKIAYGNARQTLNKEEQKLEELNFKKSSYEENLRQLRSSRLDLIKIKHGEDALEIMKLYIKQQIIIVNSAMQRLETARARLNNTMVERKIQDKLKENAFDVYRKEYDAQEQKEVDELNSFRFSDAVLVEED